MKYWRAWLILGFTSLFLATLVYSSGGYGSSAYSTDAYQYDYSLDDTYSFQLITSEYHWFPLDSSIFFGCNTVLNWCYWGGIRFPTVSLPRGGIYSSATMNVKAAQTTDPLDGGTIKLQAETSANSLPFIADDPVPSLRSKTTASILWSPSSWSQDVWYTSPDLTLLVQEITERDDWTQSSPMTIILSGNGDLQYEAYSWDGNFVPAITITQVIPQTAECDFGLSCTDSLGSEWAFTWSAQRDTGADNQILKLHDIHRTLWKDPESSVQGTGYQGFAWKINDPNSPYQSHSSCITGGGTTWANMDSNCIAKVAYDNVELSWIIGEEVNWWYDNCTNPLFSGLICAEPPFYNWYPSPEVYARYIASVSKEIQRGWIAAGGVHGRILGFYFGQDDVTSGCGVGNHTSIETYLTRFTTEWDGNGGGDVPIDAIYLIHFPGCSTNGGEQKYSDLVKSTNYWQAMLNVLDEPGYSNHTWSHGASIWIETKHGKRPVNYSLAEKCGTAHRLVRLHSFADDTGRIIGSTWLRDYASNGSVNEISRLFEDSQHSQLSVVGQAFSTDTKPSSCSISDWNY